MLNLQPNYKFVSDAFSNPNQMNDRDIPEGAILIPEGETLKVESQGLLASKNVTMETVASQSGWSEWLKGYFFSGETLFSNTFNAGKEGGWLLLEESYPHQIMECELNAQNQGVVMCKGAYVASTTNIKVDTKFAGISGYMKGKGMATTLAKLNPYTIEKTGTVFFGSANGPIRTIKITSDQPVIVDNEALVAYTEGLTCKLQRPSKSFKSLFLSGEGFVCEFAGDGLVFTGSDELKGRANHLHQIAGDLEHTVLKYGAISIVAITIIAGTFAVFGKDSAIKTAQTAGSLLKTFMEQ